MTDFNERTNTHFYKNIPLTLYSKGLMLVVCERWVEDGERLQLTHSFSAHSSAFLRRGWAAKPWVTEGHQPSVCKLILTLVSCPLHLELQLTQAVCGTWLYNCLTRNCFLLAYASATNSFTSTGQGDIPISSTGRTCFAVLLLINTCVSLDWRLGRGSICYNMCVLACI